jgi:hypothetical protein
MTFTSTGLLAAAVVALACGVMGRVLGGGGMGRFVLCVIFGFVGALLAPFAARAMHAPELYAVMVRGQAFPIAWSVIGAGVPVALVQLIA